MIKDLARIFRNLFGRRANDRVAMSEESLGQLKTQGFHLYDQGFYAESKTIFQQVFSQDKNDVDLNLRFIHCLAMTDEMDQAVDMAASLVSKEEYDGKIFGSSPKFCIVDPLMCTISVPSDGSTKDESSIGTMVHTNESQHRRRVFVYWRGKSYKLIEVLRHLMMAHSTSGVGYELIQLNRENIEQFIELPDYFDQLQLAHQADYLRVQVIHRYGGIWLDADTLVMESLDSLFDLLEKEGCFFIEGKKGVIINAVFGAIPGHPVVARWKERMESILKEKQLHIGYVEIGNNLIDRLLKSEFVDDDIHIFDGFQSMYPVFWTDCVDEYLKRPYDHYKNIERPFQPVIVLVQAVYQAMEEGTLRDIIENQSPLQQFILRSFQNLNLDQLDFIEIGTSSFKTIVEDVGENGKGICVEPVKYYLESLPDKPVVQKICAAITANRTQDYIDLYLIPPTTIEERALPRWYKGTNAIGNYHPLHIADGLVELVEVIKVPLLNIDELFVQYRIGRVEHLKIDTEGHDQVILKGLFDWLTSMPKEYFPRKITFESNELYTDDQINRVVKKTEAFGYNATTTSDGWNTILTLGNRPF